MPALIPLHIDGTPMTIAPRRAAEAARELDGRAISDIHRTSRDIAEPPTLLLTLATLIPCDPAALAATPIELIDRKNGVLRVPQDDRRFAEVAMGNAAAYAVEAATAGRTCGPLVMDVCGRALRVDDDTLGYARELLLFDALLPIDLCWTFSSLREGVVAGMLDADAPYAAVLGQAGFGAPPGVDRRWHLAQQRAVSNWWAFRIGGAPDRTWPA